MRVGSEAPLWEAYDLVTRQGLAQSATLEPVGVCALPSLASWLPALQSCPSNTSVYQFGHLIPAFPRYLMQLWSEFWIMVLLLGTNMGALIQLGEGASFAISNQWPDAPEWLYARHGIAAVIFFTICVIFPLCMLPNMRKVGAAQWGQRGLAA